MPRNLIALQGLKTNDSRCLCGWFGNEFGYHDFINIKSYFRGLEC